MKTKHSLSLLVLAGALLLAWGSPLRAEAVTAEGVNKTLTEKTYDLDTVWVLVTAFLVMWMQAGFAAVECGFTRAKNAVNICMKNLLDFSFGSVAFWVVGFGLMFSVGNAFMGKSGWFLNPDADFSPIGWTSVPLSAKFFFQLVFAATAATIVSGAMAERTKFTSYMLYSAVITAVIYPISGHWIWGAGWLSSLGGDNGGMWDFAGSTVVHSVGGWLALAGAFLLGPRIGKYGSDGKARAIPGHNIPLAALGVFILWLGWFGFNPGSTMAAARGDISHIVCTTNIAAATGVLGATFSARLVVGKWDSGIALNGALAGLVAITAPCAWVTISSAAIIGLAAGVLVLFSIFFIERILKIDDPVGAVSVHGVCGAFGTLAVGLFANPEAVGYTPVEGGPLAGLFFGGGLTQLWYQFVGVAAVFGWCLVTGLGLFLAIKYLLGLRVSAEEEIAGLDVGEHGNEAYFAFQIAEPAAVVHEPRPAVVPPLGSGQRYTVVINGAEPETVATTWSDLCLPQEAPPPEFSAVYPFMTTLQGNRFRFRGGDPGKVRLNLEMLMKERLRKEAIRASVEEN
jgi:Amt family ammonium transporter